MTAPTAATTRAAATTPQTMTNYTTTGKTETMFNFTADVPPAVGQTPMDEERCDELIAALIERPGQWAEVPYTWLAPSAEGLPESNVKQRASGIAYRIRKGTLKPFDEYPCEATARGATLYVRVAATRHKLEKLGY